MIDRQMIFWAYVSFAFITPVAIEGTLRLSQGDTLMAWLHAAIGAGLALFGGFCASHIVKDG